MNRLQTLTLGCSKNKVDTEHILSQVEHLYEIVPEGEDIPVDVLLVNTCGFIGAGYSGSCGEEKEGRNRQNCCVRMSVTALCFRTS